MDSISEFLQWLVPVLGTAIVWLTNRTLRNTRTVKEVHDTYKTMYEDQQNTLIKLQDSNEKLCEELLRLKQGLVRATSCRYWPLCPLRPELQDTTHGRDQRSQIRKSSGQHNIRNPAPETDNGPGIESGPEDSDDKPP